MPAFKTVQLYNWVTGDTLGADPCQEISDDACRHVPANFFLNALSGNMIGLAGQLTSADVVLPWLLGALGNGGLVGWLLPVMQAGLLLPQLAVANRLKALRRAKWVWVATGLARMLVLFLIIVATIILPTTIAGLTIVVLTGVYGLAAGIGAPVFVHVVAKTIPRGKRGILLGFRSSLGNLLAFGAGIIIKNEVAGTNSVAPYLILMAIGMGLWLVGSLIFAGIHEEEDIPQPVPGMNHELKYSWQVLRTNPVLQRLLLASAFLMSIQLAMPFYVLSAQIHTGLVAGSLGLFVIATALANALSNYLIGRVVDRASRGVMIGAGAMAVLTGLAALVIGLDSLTTQVYALILLLLGFARTGVQLGREVYLIDTAPHWERPLYVALMNITVGLVVAVIGGVLGALALVLPLSTLLLVFTGFSFIGMWVSWHLPTTLTYAEMPSAP